jgi:hypothetical protein
MPPETSVNNHKPKLPKTPEEHRPHIHRSASLKFCSILFFSFGLTVPTDQAVSLLANYVMDQNSILYAGNFKMKLLHSLLFNLGVKVFNY